MAAESAWLFQKSSMFHNCGVSRWCCRTDVFRRPWGRSLIPLYSVMITSLVFRVLLHRPWTGLFHHHGSARRSFIRTTSLKKTAVETHHNAFFYPADWGQGHNSPHAQLTFSLHFIKGLSEYMKLRHTESDDMNVNEGVFSVACHTG